MVVLCQVEGGVVVLELCCEYGISSVSFYKWWVKYGGMDVFMMSQMKVLEDENWWLKCMFVDLSMQVDLFKEVFGKK